MPLFNPTGYDQNDFEVLSGESVLYYANGDEVKFSDLTGLKGPTTSFKKGDLVLITPEETGIVTNSTVHPSVKKFSITGGRELCLIDVDSWYNGKPAFSNVYGKSNYAGAPGIIDSIKFILTYDNYSDSGVITVASETIIGESGFRCASTGFGSIYGFVIPVSYKIYRLK